MACCDKPEFIKRIEKIRGQELPSVPTPAPVPTPVPIPELGPDYIESGGERRTTSPMISYRNMTDFVFPTTTEGDPATGEGAPGFLVPQNPLTPPGYREVLDFNQVQYIQGFYQTQIGRFVRIDHLMGTSMIETTFGFLVAVGINYIVVQDLDTPNITSIDIYSIKTMRVFYGATEFGATVAAMTP